MITAKILRVQPDLIVLTTSQSYSPHLWPGVLVVDMRATIIIICLDVIRLVTAMVTITHEWKQKVSLHELINLIAAHEKKRAMAKPSAKTNVREVAECNEKRRICVKAMVLLPRHAVLQAEDTLASNKATLNKR